MTVGLRQVSFTNDFLTYPPTTRMVEVQTTTNGTTPGAYFGVGTLLPRTPASVRSKPVGPFSV